MTFADPNHQVDPTLAQENAAEQQSATPSQPVPEEASETSPPSESAAAARRRILIGSQRDPAAFRAQQLRDWTPIEELPKKRRAEGGKRRAEGGKPFSREGNARGTEPPFSRDPKGSENEGKANQADLIAQSAVGGEQKVVGGETLSAVPADTAVKAQAAATNGPSPVVSPLSPAPPPSAHRAAPSAHRAPPSAVPLPNLREKLSPDLEEELHRALGGDSFDELISAGGSQADEAVLEPDSLHSGRVVAVRRDDVFMELGSHEQGIVPLRQFDVPPQPGATIQVTVQQFDPEEGLYELSLPNKAVQVDDWSDLVEGKLVDVHVTGHNTGGLECEVNHIRGFIPVSQVSLYRVDDLTPYVDQRMTCIIAEADPDRRNLVLSRRAVLEREREQARQQLLATLQPGQMRDGVVRKLMDFGAFVDLGGVDGLVHISQMAWGRVKHPSDVLQEGQTIRVRVDKVDPQTGKISLAYRDLLESPWTEAARKYPSNTVVRGTVTKLMDFGAFVELEPGVEGLVHISELSHKRVWRASDVVHEGDAVEVLVLSVDANAQRISLSMKALAASAEPAKKEDESAEAAAPAQASRKSDKPQGPLLGGLGRAGGERFGLKW